MHTRAYPYTQEAIEGPSIWIGGPFFMSERVLMTAEDVRRAIVRIAHEIVEAHRGSHDLVLIGMRTRGVPLARRLAATIEQIEGDAVPVGALDIGLYRDDLSTRGAVGAARAQRAAAATSAASASCWSTTCCSPDARCAPPSTRSSTSAGRSASSSPC